MRRGLARPGARRRSATPRALPASAPAERLQKMLAAAGLASRREAEGWIRAGRLTINGAPATLGARVTPQDQVRLDGRLVRARPAAGGARVFLCHRSPGEPLRTPEGAASDLQTRLPRPGLIERLPRRAGRRFISVSPMPRVDGGLELVSSDGALAARLQRQVHALTSEFRVRVRGELSETQLAGILEGVLDSGAPLAVQRCEAAGGEGGESLVHPRRTRGERQGSAAAL